jgi:riboflavin biosynthesis pyrimidine reductase
MAKPKKLNIKNIMLASMNGKIAFHSQESTEERHRNSFTCAEDFEKMRHIVSKCDAVFIGAKSIETEKGAFRVSDLRANSDEPMWIVFTRSGNLSFLSPFWKQKNIPKSLFFVTSFDTKEEPVFSTREDNYDFGKITSYLGNINGLLDFLKKTKKTNIALLGGGKLNGAFWEQNLVDELYLTISPFLIAGEYAPGFLGIEKNYKQKLKLIKSKVSENFLYLKYQKK